MIDAKNLKYKKVCFYLYEHQNDLAHQIANKRKLAKAPNSDYAAVIRERLEQSFAEEYSAIDRHCQCCGAFTNKKKLFKFCIQYEVYWFCEGCYFSGQFKKTIRQIFL